MGAKAGNQNARKKNPRVDVHISVADTPLYQRRSKLERYLRSLGREEYTDLDIVHLCQQWLYDWIDGLEV